MGEDGTAQIYTSESVYVSDSVAATDLVSNIFGTVSDAGDIKDLSDLIGISPTIGASIKNAVSLYGIFDKLKKGLILSSGTYQVESIVVQSPYFSWYSYRVNTLYGIEKNTAYYQWVDKDGVAFGCFPGGDLYGN